MSDTESEEYNTDTNTLKITNSQYLLNQMFQTILDQQEEILITNFSILMEQEDILLDAESRNELLQEQFQSLVQTLTTEFEQMLEERHDKEKDEFKICPICQCDEIPYLKLSCNCQIMLHKECYMEYLNESRQLKCPICQQSIFVNYLSKEN